MDKTILSTGAILGIIAIILGAFGAHALKKMLSIDQLSTFETGVRYQMYHALFLLFLGLMTQVSQRTKKTIFLLVLVGVILFSGSLYLLATNDLTSFNFTTIGFVTPIGGLLLIVAWCGLLMNIMQKKSQK